ncbi:MAG: BadF/BadG/BcrA/BcrD ATPase family protein [Candidatus Lernaella stagnicola]|nr:BadF/BadG/BcrA/BcrD ATPase family protein [Candidatus Lernaella stagnicola]
MAEKVYVGLDSGGTKTEVAILARNGAVLTQQLTGPVRLTARRASKTIVARTKEIISFSLEEAGAAWDDVAYFGFGMCGADYADELPAQRRSLARGLGIPEDEIALVNDGVAALWGGSDKQRAVILQLGTAFTAAYRSGFGSETPFDHLNAGVMMEVRRAILIAAARVWDGRLPKSILLELLLTHFEEKSPVDIMRKYVRGTLDTWKMLTVIVPWKTAVEKGDEVSLMILEEAAEIFAGDVCFMIDKIHNEPVDVVLGGGLLAYSPARFRRRIGELIRVQHPRVTIHPPRLQPAVGAAVMAAYLDGREPGPFYRGARASLKG